MIFNYFVLFVAFLLSSVSAYYSVIGLTAIFPGAFWSIVILGTTLEIGKIATAIWLHRYWKRSSLSYKLYLVPALVILMTLTSIGVFGFLSKAHSEQNLLNENVVAQLSILDEKIKTQRENIEIARRALAQMDSQVEARLSRSSDETGAERAVTIRRQQAVERTRLQKEIGEAQKIIAQLNEERAPIAAQNREVEVKVGPIKYIAALIYGDSPDSALLERSVRWVIILLVIVFDPLAIVLILAANNSIKWEQENNLSEKNIESENNIIIGGDDNQDSTVSTVNTTESTEKSKLQTDSEPAEQSVDENNIEKNTETEKVATSFHDNFYSNTKYNIENTYIKLHPDSTEEQQEISTKEKIRFLDDQEYVHYDGKLISINALKEMRPDLVINSSEVDVPVIKFSPVFPKEAVNGEYCIRIDKNPHAVYRFIGTEWIEIDKNQNTVYLKNRDYVLYLIKKLEREEYSVDNLTVAEQAEISNLLDRQ